jgi:hypothetical protein
MSEKVASTGVKVQDTLWQHVQPMGNANKAQCDTRREPECLRQLLRTLSYIAKVCCLAHSIANPYISEYQVCPPWVATGSALLKVHGSCIDNQWLAPPA